LHKLISALEARQKSAELFRAATRARLSAAEFSRNYPGASLVSFLREYASDCDRSARLFDEIYRARVCPTCLDVGGYCGGSSHPACGNFEGGHPAPVQEAM